MNYKAYRLNFEGAVHFGMKSLEDGEYTVCADTLFSALCQEAVKMGMDSLEELCQYTKDGKILFSDAFPYIKDTYFLPKPMKRIEMEERNGDSVIKKAYKKLKYIPINAFESYLRGEYDILNAPDMRQLGQFQMKISASIRGEEETKPYRVGMYYYYPGNGLYIIVGYEETGALELVEELLERLSFSGIGGKRTSGLGRFVLLPGKISEDLVHRLKREGRQYMTLSVSLPMEAELEEALQGAEYLLSKRSGFVASQQYAKEQMRKNDLYVFRAGSCFCNKYNGDVYDVSEAWGKHPVYRYAKPMFMGVDA